MQSVKITIRLHFHTDRAEYIDGLKFFKTISMPFALKFVKTISIQFALKCFKTISIPFALRVLKTISGKGANNEVAIKLNFGYILLHMRERCFFDKKGLHSKFKM